MKNSGSAGTIIVALFCAGVMLLIVMLAMPTVQPVLVSTTTAIATVLSSDADWASDFASNTVVPIMPIALPVITFIGVFLRVSKGEKVV